MVQLDVKPPEDLMAFKSDKLRAMFKENIDDVRLDNAELPEGIQKLFNKNSHGAPKTGQDHQNELALRAQIGDSSADLTTAGQEKKRKEDQLHKQNTARSTILSPIIDNSFNINLDGIRLDDEHMVHINDDNILMVRGEGPDSELRAATIDEQIQIENETGACSIASTEQAMEIEAYLSGNTDVIPDALRDLAEEHGRLAEDVNPSEFKEWFAEKHTNQFTQEGEINLSYAPHIMARITAPLDLNNLTPDMSSPEITPAPDAPAPVLAQTPMM